MAVGPYPLSEYTVVPSWQKNKINSYYCIQMAASSARLSEQRLLAVDIGQGYV